MGRAKLLLSQCTGTNARLGRSLALPIPSTFCDSRSVVLCCHV